MKKVLGLFLVILFVSGSVLAQDKGNDKRSRKDRDPAERWEKAVEDLKLDDKQATEFKKIHEDYQKKMQADWEAKKADREAVRAQREKQREEMLAMRNERNAEIKKILTDEQYQKYVEKQQQGNRQPKDGMHKRGDRKGKGRK